MRSLLVACALAAVPVLPAWAQQSAEQDDPGIVVEGQRDQRKQIREFLGALVPGSRSDQIAQFHHDACPVALGLSAELDGAITRRLRQVARTAEVPLGKPECRPNVMVLFAPDKKAFIEALYKTYPRMFGERTTRQVRRLAEEPGPATAWHVESLMNEDGTPVSQDAETGVIVSETSGAASRLRSPTKPYFVGAILVLERKVLGGLAVTQVADYAAMRVFADTDPERLPEGADTILSVLEDAKIAGGPIALSLTQWDLSFLKSLYATDNSLYAPGQRSQMRHAFEKDLKKAAADGADDPDKKR